MCVMVSKSGGAPSRWKRTKLSFAKSEMRTHFVFISLDAGKTAIIGSQYKTRDENVFLCSGVRVRVNPMSISPLSNAASCCSGGSSCNVSLTPAYWALKARTSSGKKTPSPSRESQSTASRFRPCGAFRSLHSAVHPRQGLHCFSVKDFPLRRELHCAFCSCEQLKLEFILKVCYGATDSRLGNVQPPRSFAIALPPHNGREISKVAQFHIDARFLSILIAIYDDTSYRAKTLIGRKATNGKADHRAASVEKPLHLLRGAVRDNGAGSKCQAQCPGEPGERTCPRTQLRERRDDSRVFGCRYKREQVMELLIEIALKTISNYLDHMSPLRLTRLSPPVRPHGASRRPVPASDPARLAGVSGCRYCSA